jgi:hypothetical protein
VVYSTAQTDQKMCSVGSFQRVSENVKNGLYIMQGRIFSHVFACASGYKASQGSDQGMTQLHALNKTCILIHQNKVHLIRVDLSKY